MITFIFWILVVALHFIIYPGTEVLFVEFVLTFFIYSLLSFLGFRKFTHIQKNVFIGVSTFGINAILIWIAFATDPGLSITYTLSQFIKFALLWSVLVTGYRTIKRQKTS